LATPMSPAALAPEDDAEGARPVPERNLGAQTLERGLTLLALAASEPMTVGNLAHASGLPLSIVRRLVKTLIAREFLAIAPDSVVRGGGELLRLSQASLQRLDLVSVARPWVLALARQTGLSAFLGRRELDKSVHLMRAAGAERVAVTTGAGSTRFLPETGLGKALLLDDDVASWTELFGAIKPEERGDWLAEMTLAAERGVVLKIGPAPDCINAVAAPVRDATGRIVAAINVAAQAQYLDDERMAEVATAVLDTALSISRELGFAPGMVANPPSLKRPRKA
jgi:DNA-binding IclR family transcriptional regulator